MSRVTELRDSINQVIPWGGALEQLNALIAAARVEEAEQVKASLAFVQYDDVSRNQQSVNPTLDQIEKIISMLGTVDEDTRIVVRQMLYDLASIARVDGRNEEKVCVRRALDPHVPASLLAPATKEADRGNS